MVMSNKNSEEERLVEEINKIKKAMGDNLIILAHHYQRDDIVNLADFSGDSFELSQWGAQSQRAKHIVFCGVHFMAESSAILAGTHQIVQIPDKNAGCPMADMADIHNVENAWEQLASVVDTAGIIPVVYINSAADLKAFCGRNGGLVCTSSNAAAAFEWAFGVGEKIFFFPDQHLGRNTGNQMGVAPEEMIIWNSLKPLGGNSLEAIQGAKVILWDGYCPVHVRFTEEHIREMRKKFPEAKIVVHPECTEEVAALSDAVGSTGYIVKYIKEAAPGSTVIVGTEINLVKRLAQEYHDKNKKVVDIHNSSCVDMRKIDLKKLLVTLENIGKVNVMNVDDAIREDARKALERMLDLPRP